MPLVVLLVGTCTCLPTCIEGLCGEKESPVEQLVAAGRRMDMLLRCCLLDADIPEGLCVVKTSGAGPAFMDSLNAFSPLPWFSLATTLLLISLCSSSPLLDLHGVTVSFDLLVSLSSCSSSSCPYPYRLILAPSFGVAVDFQGRHYLLVLLEAFLILEADGAAGRSTQPQVP
jgi:hypothetical protein